MNHHIREVTWDEIVPEGCTDLLQHARELARKRQSSFRIVRQDEPVEIAPSEPDPPGGEEVVEFDPIAAIVEEHRASIDAFHRLVASSPKAVIRAAAKHYRVSTKEIVSETRRLPFAIIRMEVMWVLRNRLKLSYLRISAAVNRIDHTTSISGIKKIQRLIDEGKRDAPTWWPLKAEVQADGY